MKYLFQTYINNRLGWKVAYFFGKTQTSRVNNSSLIEMLYCPNLCKAVPKWIDIRHKPIQKYKMIDDGLLNPEGFLLKNKRIHNIDCNHDN